MSFVRGLMVLILLWRVWPFDLCHDAMREVVQVLVSFVEGKGLWLAVVGCLQDLGYPQKVDNFLSGMLRWPYLVDCFEECHF